MGLKGRFFAAAITLAAASAASAQFWSVGRPAGEFSYSQVSALSADGRIAAGFAAQPALQLGHGFIWSSDAGRYDFGTEPGIPPYSGALGISGDGQVMVGASRFSHPGAPLQRAYRWSGPGTFQTLGDPGHFTASFAIDANHDGSVIVGHLTDNRGGSVRPFRWTAAGGLQSLGYAGGNDTDACAISDDGNKIVGFVSSAGRGFVWTVNRGYEYVSGLPGGDGLSALLGMNRAGTIYVGYANIEATGAMWINDTVIDLGKLAGERDFRALCVDDFGQVVAGNSESGATVWTQGRGIELLSDYLVAQGLTLPMGLILSTCESLSADGRTFAGRAYTPTDGVFGYVVTIPSPSTFVVDASACIFSIRRRRGLVTA